MNWNLFLLFAACAAAPLLAAAGDAEYPASYERFWETVAPIYPFSMACADNLPHLQIEDALPMQEYEAERLRAIDGFEDPLASASKARSEITQAKESSTLDLYGIARLPLYEDYVYQGMVVASVAAPAPIFNIPASCFVDFTALPSICREVRNAACAGMSHSTEALARASYAAEDARNIALEEAQALGFMGAACSGYSGPERRAYFDAMDSLNHSERFTASKSAAWMVHDSFARGNAHFSDSQAYVNAFNLAVGGEGLVVEWAHTAESLRSAQNEMQASFAGSLREYSVEREFASNDMKAISRNGYGSIDYSKFSGDSGIAHGALRASPPSEAISEAESMLGEADRLITQANSLSRSENTQCYLSNALLNVEEASLLASESRALLSQTEEEADGWLQEFESSLGQRLNSARVKFSEFNTTAPGAVGLKARASIELEKAESLLSSARLANAGAKAAKFSEAASHLDAVESLLSPEGAGMAALFAGANSSLSRLESLAELAEKDGLDTGLETEFVSTARASLIYATAEDLVYLDSRAETLAAGLHAKAKERYGYLDAELFSLAGSFAAVRAYSSVSGSPSRLRDEIDAIGELQRNYCVGGKIDPRLALGEYKKIAQAIGKAEDAFSSAQDGLISDALALLARVSCSFGEDALLNEPAKLESIITLENPFPFGSSGAVKLELADPCGFASTSLGGDGFTYARSDGRRIELMVGPVAPHSKHSISLEGEEIVAELEASSDSILVISEDELTGTSTIRFSASRNLNLLTVKFPLGISPTSFQASATGARVSSAERSGNNVDVTLSRVQEGSGSVSLRYSYANPYSITQSGWGSEQVDNATYLSCFDATVRASVSIPQFNATVLLQNVSARNSSPGVSDESGAIGFSVEQVSGSTLLTWQVGAMEAGGERSFRICHSFRNATYYSETLLEEAEARADALRASGLLSAAEISALSQQLSDARNFVASGDNAAALKAIQQALATASQYDRTAADRLREKSLLETSLSDWEGELDSASSLSSALESAGFAEEASAFRSCVSLAEQKAGEAGLLAAQSLFKEARTGQESALKSLRSCAPKSSLSKREQELSSQKSSLEKNATPLLALGFASLSSLADADLALKDAHSKISSGNLLQGTRSLSLAKGFLANASLELDANYAQAEQNLTASLSLFQQLKPDAEDAAASFNQASTLSAGRTPAGSELGELNGGSAEDAESGLGKQLISLSDFFSTFSSTADKRQFISKNTAKISKSMQSLESLNSTIATLQNASASYGSVAEGLITDAENKLSQAAALLPPADAYSAQLSSANQSIAAAKGAFADKRFADSIVASESAITTCSKLLLAASQIEQKQATNGFSLQPVHLLLPGLLLALGFVYVKGKKKKPELKKLPRIDEGHEF